MSPLAVAILITASFAACVSTRPVGDSQPCPCAPGWSCDTRTDVCVEGAGGAGGQHPTGTAGSGVGGSAGTPGLRSYSAAELQTALAQCDLAHGPAVSSPTYGDKRALMLGGWIDCPPSIETVFSPGIVFIADGSWQRFLSDGQGGLVPGLGVQNQGTYSFPYPDTASTDTNSSGIENPYVTVSAASFDFSPIGYSDGALTLETSPSRIHVIITYIDQNIEVWLVRLPLP